MGYIIALAGKGGTGKTTIAALLVRLLKENGKGSILAVDADPNNNLAEHLGIEVRETIGSILDGISRNPAQVPAGMSKDRFIELKVQSSVSEGDGFDLIAMGRPEGPGCYCYVNNILRNVVGILMKDYDYVIIDNEAGLEHFSRRTTRKAEVLLIVSDSTVVGLKAAGRIGALIKEMEIKAKKNFLIINREEKKIDKDKTDISGLEYLGNIPEDPAIGQASQKNGSLWKIHTDSPAMITLRTLGEKIWDLS